jgi:ketosteroid isomerase-like protein
MVTTETLSAIADAFNRHDVDGVMSFFADDVVFETPKGPEPCGRRLVGADAVREGVAARFAGNAMCVHSRSEQRGIRATP